MTSQSGWHWTLGLGMVGAVLLVGAAVASFRSDPNGYPGDSLRPTFEQEVEQIKQALSAGDLSEATHRWTDAYVLAVRMRRWEPMAVTGDLAVELSLRDSVAEPFRENARRAYWSGLFRARAEDSSPGALRIAASLAALGDAELAMQARRIADQLTADRPRS